MALSRYMQLKVLFKQIFAIYERPVAEGEMFCGFVISLA